MKWPSKRISFAYTCCPVCSAKVTHALLEPKMKPHLCLENRIRDMSVRRLKFENFRNCPKGKNLALEIEELLGRPIAVGKSSFFDALLDFGGMGNIGGRGGGRAGRGEGRSASLQHIKDREGGVEEKVQIVDGEDDNDRENDKKLSGDNSIPEKENGREKGTGHKREDEGALDSNTALSKKLAKKAAQLEDIAMERYSYYICSMCEEPYFGGESACEAALADDGDDESEDGDGNGDGNAGQDRNGAGEGKVAQSEYVCGSCRAKRSRGSSKAQCPDHGTSMIEYKCRFCCSVATWYCWGTTHFCTDCHTKQMNGTYVSRMSKDELPKCPGKDQCPLGGFGGAFNYVACCFCFGVYVHSHTCSPRSFPFSLPLSPPICLHLTVGIDHPPNGEEFALGCALCRGDSLGF